MTTPAPALDLSDLSPEAVRQVRELAEQLRAAQLAEPGRPSHLRPGQTPDEWVAELRAWAASRKSRNPNVDDSRESIYD